MNYKMCSLYIECYLIQSSLLFFIDLKSKMRKLYRFRLKCPYKCLLPNIDPNYKKCMLHM